MHQEIETYYGHENFEKANKERYNPNKNQDKKYDIALMKSKEPIILGCSTNVYPVCLSFEYIAKGTAYKKLIHYSIDNDDLIFLFLIIIYRTFGFGFGVSKFLV